jgi:hypothetical protein
MPMELDSGKFHPFTLPLVRIIFRGGSPFESPEFPPLVTVPT